MLHRLTPLERRYASFVLWGAVNGVIGAFGLVPMGFTLEAVWPMILPLALVSTGCAVFVFDALIQRSWQLQGIGFLVVGFLISPVLVFGSNLVRYRDLRCHGGGDCGLVMLVTLIFLWLIFLVLGAISAIVYWGLGKAGRI